MKVKITAEQREAIKRNAKEELGITITDADIDRSAAIANQKIVVKQEVRELTKHMWEHHYAGPLAGLGIETLKEIHETAPKQGSHPEEEEVQA